MTDQDTTGEPPVDDEAGSEEGDPEPETTEERGANVGEVSDGTTEETETAEQTPLEDEESDEADRIAELESQLARKQADFENYKKRMDRRRAEERERATEDLVTRLLSVRDDLDRALAQGEDADIRGGVESTLTEFDRVLADEGVDEISPEPGSEVDPGRHEVMLRVDSEQPESRVAEVFRPGYVMGGKVLRPAQITVSDGTSTEE